MIPISRILEPSPYGPSRREFLRAGAAGALGTVLGTGLGGPVQARETVRRARSVIMLWLWGGPSHLDTFDMKPDTVEAYRSEFKSIASDTPGIRLTEHLPRFARVLGKFAQVRSVNHRMGNHNSAGYYSLTGHAPPVDDQRLRDTLELFPSYGSVASRFRPTPDPSLPNLSRAAGCPPPRPARRA